MSLLDMFLPAGIAPDRPQSVAGYEADRISAWKLSSGYNPLERKESVIAI